MFSLKEMGQRIKQRRLELDLTQEELAKAAGYTSRSSINKIELGKVDLTQSKLTAIAKALSVSPIELMGYSTQTQPEKVLENSFMTSLEKELLKAFRAHPERRAEVEKLLGIEGDYTELYEAASSSDNRPPKIVQKSRAEWEIISNAPATDDELK